MPTLLPRTDCIAFVRENTEPILVSWQKAEQVVGHLFTPQDIYPERVRVDEFPSADELAQAKGRRRVVKEVRSHSESHCETASGSLRLRFRNRLQ